MEEDPGCYKKLVLFEYKGVNVKMSYLGMVVLLLALTIFSSSPVLATRDLSPPPGEAPPPPPEPQPQPRLVRRFPQFKPSYPSPDPSHPDILVAHLLSRQQDHCHHHIFHTFMDSVQRPSLTYLLHQHHLILQPSSSSVFHDQE
ncbi:hypothetical protein Fmac_026455 [Flemingia macrophylla]|uniref:Uncharacterized protein n=1 Tax=Flemingia macrophylla TaxID=520843 RepID=A0ABD1LEZ3_9FABA